MKDIETVLAGLGRRFIARPDVKAVQHRDGTYHPDRSPFKRRDLRAHLLGELSLGHYMVNGDGQCKLFALDLDLDKEGWWEGGVNLPRAEWQDPEETQCKRDLRTELFTLATGLACWLRRMTDLPVAVAYSGSKGVHVYGFTGLVPAAEARAYPLELLRHLSGYEPTKKDNFWKRTDGEFPNVTIEVFPKQDQIKDGGFGNLMRLPLGKNARSGEDAYFLKPDKWEPADPVAALEEGTVTPEWLKEPAE